MARDFVLIRTSFGSFRDRLSKIMEISENGSFGDDPGYDFQNFRGSTFWEFRGLESYVIRRWPRRWFSELLRIDFLRSSRSRKLGLSEMTPEMILETFGDRRFFKFEINFRRRKLSGDVRTMLLRTKLNVASCFFCESESACARAFGFHFLKIIILKS